MDVAGDSRCRGTLRQNSKVILWVDHPEKDHFCDIDIFGFANAEDGLILYEFFVPLGKRRVGLDNDSVFPASLDGVLLDIHGMKLKLVNNWLVLRDAYDVFDVYSEEVRNS